MEKRLFSAFLFSAAALLFCEDPQPDRIQKYLQFARQHSASFGQLGAWKSSEIEIVLSPDRIQKIEKQTASRLQAKGCPEKEAKLWSNVGIVAEDAYWIWIRDAVIFPSGVYGTYDRLMWKNGLEGGTPCVAMLPILSNKKVIVNVAYRHATRSWEIELPRGHKKKEESNEHAAIRELHAETGYKAANCSLLGTMAPDSGVLMNVVPIFYAEVKHAGQTHKIYSKAIAQNPAFTKDEIKEGFLKGFIELSIKGDPIKVHCRDPYLAFAILQAEMKHLL